MACSWLAARWPGRCGATGVLLVACVLALLAGCGVLADESPITRDSPHLHWRAEFTIDDGERPPGDAAAWRRVELPDSWRGTERWKDGLSGWYRITLAGPAPVEATSVYLWRFSMNAAVWFNGEFIGDGGSFDEPIARNWNRPLIFALPAALWRDGANVLHVRLRTYPGFGHLMPVAVGPTDLLAPDHERRTFFQVTLSQVAAGITLIALLTGAILWLVDRSDAAMPYFVLFCLGWLLYGANSWVRDIPVSAKAWWWAVHSCADLNIWSASCCFHRLLGSRRPRIEGAMLAWVAACALMYAVWGLPQLARYSALTHAVSVLGGVYLAAWLVWRWLERRQPERLVFALAVLGVLAGGVFDLLLNSLLIPELWRSRSYLTHLVAPLLFLGVIAMLALRAARGMQAIRASKAELEQRVEAASAELAAGYERERALLAQRSAANERERIYRDLHDNLGARLLSLVYSARDESQAALARDALTEMRTLIKASQSRGGRLAELATDWRIEAELRCEHARTQLGFTLAGDADIDARQREQIETMLRELLSNAIEHGRPRRIDVELQVEFGALRMIVADDGRGVAEPGALDGHGIRSVRERARQLGGWVAWQHREGGGTACTLHLPLGGGAGGLQ